MLNRIVPQVFRLIALSVRFHLEHAVSGKVWPRKRRRITSSLLTLDRCTERN
jgi:hypothetical protein